MGQESESQSQPAKTKTIKIGSNHEMLLSSELLWSRITDPKILQPCLKGCSELNKPRDGEYCAVFDLKIGPVKKQFAATLKIIDGSSKDNYRLAVSVDSNIKARAEASAHVTLTSLAQHKTRIDYQAEIVMHGWLSQLQPMMLEHFAKKQVARFFDRIGNIA